MSFLRTLNITNIAMQQAAGVFARHVGMNESFGWMMRLFAGVNLDKGFFVPSILRRAARPARTVSLLANPFGSEG